MAGLYIHIPFCHSKCAYCDFYSMPKHADMYSQYVEVLCEEWIARKDEVREPIQTVYIGGGTPSILPCSLFQSLCERLELDLAQIEEFTVEVNPEDVNARLLDVLISNGVNRISMGIQSLVDNELRAVGRRHSPTQALTAIRVMKDAGIYNISGDLIYGLPGQTIDTWRYSVDRLLDTGIPHLSAYSLTYEEGTRLWAMLQTGKVAEASDDMVAEMYEYLCKATAAAGMEHYEISNFGISGMHSKHNSSYWDYSPYIGLGPGAHSFDGSVRRANIRDVREYMSTHAQAYEIEHETDDSRYNDYLITALRTSRGIDPCCFNNAEMSIIRKQEAAGRLVRLPDGHYRITEQGWLMADAIMTDLIRV